jgi:hypothetical protein
MHIPRENSVRSAGSSSPCRVSSILQSIPTPKIRMPPCRSSANIMYIYMYICMYVCSINIMYICTYVCMYVCMYVCSINIMYICTYVCIYVCSINIMYVCTYVCIRFEYTDTIFCRDTLEQASFSSLCNPK